MSGVTDVGSIRAFLLMDDTQFEHALDEAIAKAEALSGKKIRVDVDESGLTKVSGAAKDAARDLDIVDNETKKVAKSSTDSSHSVGLLTTAIAMLAPATIPIAAAAAGAGMALGGMGVAGLLAFKGIQAEMAAGTAEGLAFRAGLDEVQTGLSGIEQIAAHNMLGPFQIAVADMHTQLPGLSTEFGTLSSMLGQAGDEAVNGALAAFHDLSPMMNVLSADAVTLLQRFDAFAHGNGLTQFGAYVVSVFPEVLSTIQSVVTAAGHIVVAFSGVGTGPLIVLRTFADLINAIPLNILQDMAPAISAAGIAWVLWKDVPAIVSGVSGALKVLNITLEDTSVAEKAVSTSVPIIGIALAGLTAIIQHFQQESQQAAQAQDNLNMALDQSKGAIDANVRAAAAKNLQDSGALTLAQQMGVNVTDLTQAYLGNTGALGRVKDEVVAWGKASGVSNVANVLQTASAKQLFAAIASGNATVAQHAAEQKLLAQATQGTATAEDRAAVVAANWAALAASSNSVISQQTVVLDALNAAWEVQNDRVLAAKNAQAGFYEAAETATHVTDAQGRAVTITTADLNKHSKAIDEGALAMGGLIDKAEQSISQNQAQGASLSRLQGDYQNYRAELIAAAERMGYTQAAAKRLVDQEFAIPKSITTTVTANTAYALSKIKGLSAYLQTINGQTSTVYIRTVQETIRLMSTTNADVTPHGMLRAGQNFFGSITPMAEGGITAMAAGITAMAAGGTLPSSATIASDGGNLIQWAESGTGGEAFIPLGGYNRSRSIGIWEETGRRLGVMGNGQGRPPVIVYVQSPIDGEYLNSTIVETSEGVYNARAAQARIQQRAGLSAEGMRASGRRS